MNDFQLDEMEFQAYQQLALIGEVKRLRKENEYLKRQVKRYDDHMDESLKESNKFIGEMLTTMVRNVTQEG